MNNRVSGNWWVENMLRPLLIAAMMVCLAVPFVMGLEWLLTGWDGTYFLAFCFLAALEGILSERALRNRRIGGYTYLGSRAAELLILLLVLKLLNYLPLGFDQLLRDALLWPTDPGLFVGFIDLLTALLFVPLWVGALYVARQAAELDVDEGKVSPPPDKTSPEYYMWLTQPPPVRHRQEALDWLGEAFLWGGVGLLCGSMVVHLLLSTAGALALSTLLYFALGVALLSQARFSVTHAGWQTQGIPVQRGIARRWLLWVVVFLVGVALTALLLPTEYTMGPFLALYSLIGLVMQVVMVAMMFISYLMVLLLSLIFPGVEQPSQPPQGLESIVPAEPQVAGSSPPWLEVLASVLFWGLILFIVGYALLRFLKDRWGPALEGDEAEGTLWGRLLAWLRSLWRHWLGWQHGVQERLARRRAEREAAGGMGARLSRFLSLRRLPPRELVRYFYLSATRRAAQAGQPRQAGQTPYEYQEALDERFPDLEPDLTGLTDAFVQARYSPGPVYKEDADAVKPLWQRIKAALQRWRRADA